MGIRGMMNQDSQLYLSPAGKLPGAGQNPTSAPPSTGRHTPVTYLAASEQR